ncbi:sensor domain-containing diguanylate cyclase [Acidobacteriota bacterium]
MNNKLETESSREPHIEKLVSERSQIEQRLRKSEKKYLDLLEHLPVGVYRTNPDGIIIEANQNLVNLFGYQDIKELKNVNVNDLYVDELDRKDHLRKLDSSPTFFTEFRLKKKGENIIWVRDYPRAVKGSDGSVRFYYGILVDITEQRETEGQLQQALEELEISNKERQEVIVKLESLSLLDDLTSLYNRRGFFSAAKGQLHQAEEQKFNLFLMFLDIDDLKIINDTWGHQVGDLAINEFVNILNDTLRKSDIKGRMGGDEFAVIAREPFKELPENIITRLENQITAFNKKKNFPFKLSISAGITRFDPENPKTIDELVREADALMYKKKRNKKNNGSQKNQ